MEWNGRNGLLWPALRSLFHRGFMQLVIGFVARPYSISSSFTPLSFNFISFNNSISFLLFIKGNGGKTDGMEFLWKKWNGIQLRQRGLRPITHNKAKEKGRTTKLLSLIPQFFISLINQQRNEEFAGIAFFSFIKEKTSRRPSTQHEEKKRKKQTAKSSPHPSILSLQREKNWLDWLLLPCRASLGAPFIHQFHWRKSFTQSINWFHSTLSFHSIDFIHSLFNPLIPLPFFLPPSSLSRGALRLQPPLTHSKEKAGRKATPSKLFRSAQPSIKPNQLPNQFH